MKLINGSPLIGSTHSSQIKCILIRPLCARDIQLLAIFLFSFEKALLRPFARRRLRRRRACIQIRLNNFPLSVFVPLLFRRRTRQPKKKEREKDTLTTANCFFMAQVDGGCTGFSTCLESDYVRKELDEE